MKHLTPAEMAACKAVAMTPQSKREALRAIFRAAAERHELDEADLYVRDRRAHVVVARHEAWHNARWKARFTCQAIADLAGWDCSTVIEATNKKKAKPAPLENRGAS